MLTDRQWWWWLRVFVINSYTKDNEKLAIPILQNYPNFGLSMSKDDECTFKGIKKTALLI